MSVGVLVAVGGVDYEVALLHAVTGPDFHVVRRCVDVADLLATAATRQADVAVVSAQLRGLDVDVVSRLREETLVVVGAIEESSSADEALLRRLGIRVVIPADRLSDFTTVTRGALVDPAGFAESDSGRALAAHEGDRSVATGQLIAVWGPAGAPGRSTVALGLSAELAHLDVRTLLVDADVYGGAIAAMLGMLDESSGLLAAARSANRGGLDRDVLASHARQVDARLRVLTGLPRADRWTEVRTPLMRNVLDAARGLAAYTIVDCGFSLELDEELAYDTVAPRRNGVTLTVLAEADRIVVVGAADPLSLSRLVRGLHDLSVAVPEARLEVVINRMRPRLGWSERELTETVMRASGVTRLTVLPDDPEACDRALVHGRTLTECAREARLTHALATMAVDLAGVDTVALKRRRAARAR